MKLEKKKRFIANVLGVGKDRVTLNLTRLSEIKEALTRQDIRDLQKDGAILIKEIKGRAKIVPRKWRRRAGSRRKSLRSGKRSKRAYIIITRKLRRYLAELLKAEKITEEQYLKLRREIRMHAFKDKAHIVDRIKILKEAK